MGVWRTLKPTEPGFGTTQESRQTLSCGPTEPGLNPTNSVSILTMTHTGNGSHRTVTRMGTTTTQWSTQRCARPTLSSGGRGRHHQPPNPLLLQVVSPIMDQQQMKPGGTWTGPLGLELEEEEKHWIFPIK